MEAETFNLTDNCRIVFQVKQGQTPLGGAIVNFFDNKTGFAVYHTRITSNSNTMSFIYNHIYRTDDSGETWNLITIDSLPSSYKYQQLLQIDKCDDSTAFGYYGCRLESDQNLETNPSSVLKISLKNNKMERYIIPDAHTPINIVCYDSDTLFCLSEQKLLKSTDRGLNWKHFNFTEPNEFNGYLKLEKTEDNCLFLWSDNTGFIGDRVRRSTDGGCTWEEFSLPKLTFARYAFDKNRIIIGCDTIPKSMVQVNLETNTFDTVFQYKGFVKAYYEYFLHSKSNQKLLLLITYSDNILVSLDGGYTFIKDSLIYNSETLRDYVKADFCGETLCFFCPWNAIIYKQTKLYTDVTDDIPHFKTKLFPNPAMNEKPISLSLENDRIRAVKLSIYNSTGTLIDISQIINIPIGYHTIDYTPRGFQPGAYFIVIESGNEILVREKFVVE